MKRRIDRLVHRLGDLDGDSFAEVAVGEPNFHLRGPGRDPTLPRER